MTDKPKTDGTKKRIDSEFERGMELFAGLQSLEVNTVQRREALVPRELLGKLTEPTIHAMFVDLVGLTTRHSRHTAETTPIDFEFKKQWLLRQ